MSWLALLVVPLLWPCTVSDSSRAKAVRETIEFLARTLGKEVAEQGVEGLTRRVELLAAKHGDDVLTAIKKAGPRALSLIEHDADLVPQAARLLARYGEEAIPLLSGPTTRKLVRMFGDEAAEAWLKHPGIAETLIKAHGHSSVRAMQSLDPQNGRRLAMLAQSGELDKMGRTPELLGVIGRLGNEAMDFVWRHKGALTVTTVLAAFLTHPEPFIAGIADITKVIGESAVRPLAEVPGKVAQEAARGTNWTIIGIVALLLVAGYLTYLTWRRERAAVARKG